jgi:hypothetical protein
MMMMFFWVLGPCRLIGRCQYVEETFCLHLHGCSGDAGKLGDLCKLEEGKAEGVGQ